MKNFLRDFTSYAEFGFKNYFNIKHTAVPEYLLRKIKPDSIVIDCGANIGEVSFPMVKSGAKLFCFEPHPIAFLSLKEKFSGIPNVQLFESAVGIQDRKAKLYKHVESNTNELKYSTGSSLYSFKNNVNPNDYYEIEVIDLLRFIDSLKARIFILKIDIEGGEVELLNKLIDTETYKKIDFIFVETHERKMQELAIPTKDLKSKIKRLAIENIYTNWT